MRFIFRWHTPGHAYLFLLDNLGHMGLRATGIRLYTLDNRTRANLLGRVKLGEIHLVGEVLVGARWFARVHVALL